MDKEEFTQHVISDFKQQQLLQGSLVTSKVPFFSSQQSLLILHPSNMYGTWQLEELSNSTTDLRHLKHEVHVA